jgi:histidine phosphotransfer protein HptB
MLDRTVPGARDAVPIKIYASFPGKRTQPFLRPYRNKWQCFLSAHIVTVVRGPGRRTAVDGSDNSSQPFVDLAVLETLRSELEPDSGYCKVFVNSYIQQLPRRLARLRRAVEAMDLDAAMDAVLSLKTSSRMVGAAHLGTLADELESILRRSAAGPWPERTQPDGLQLALLESMDACAGHTVAGLSAAAA